MGIVATAYFLIHKEWLRVTELVKTIPETTILLFAWHNIVNAFSELNRLLAAVSHRNELLPRSTLMESNKFSYDLFRGKK